VEDTSVHVVGNFRVGVKSGHASEGLTCACGDGNVLVD
jgi:hypothetical protein